MLRDTCVEHVNDRSLLHMLCKSLCQKNGRLQIGTKFTLVERNITIKKTARIKHGSIVYQRIQMRKMCVHVFDKWLVAIRLLEVGLKQFARYPHLFHTLGNVCCLTFRCVVMQRNVVTQLRQMQGYLSAQPARRSGY